MLCEVYIRSDNIPNGVLLKNFSPLAIVSLIGSSYLFLDCLLAIIYHLFSNQEHPDFELVPVEKFIGIDSLYMDVLQVDS